MCEEMMINAAILAMFHSVTESGWDGWRVSNVILQHHVNIRPQTDMCMCSRLTLRQVVQNIIFISLACKLGFYFEGKEV